MAVDIDPLPAVVGTESSARDEVLLFPEAGTNVLADFGEPAPEDFFAGCEVVVTQRIVNQRVAPVPLETRAAAAAWGEDGRVTIWCSNQGAQGAQMGIASWLGLDPSLVHLITPAVGGGFGAKIGADPEFALVAHAARIVGRPVRWAESRSENLLGMLHGRGQDQVVTIGGRRDGTVEAYSLVVDQDAGAYPRLGVVLPTLTMLMAPGVYAFPKVHAQARALATNTTSIGAYRGAGRPEATAAVERAIDLFAAEIEHGPGRGAPDQPDPPVRLPAHHDDGRDVRHRRLRRGAGQGAGGRRVRRAAGGAGAPTGGRRRPSARHRARRSTWRSPAPAASRARPPRRHASKSTPTARPPSSPAPHRTGRGTRQHGR